MAFKEVQSENVSALISSTEGSVTFSSEEHPEKAFLPISATFSPSFYVFISVLPLNAFSETESTGISLK